MRRLSSCVVLLCSALTIVACNPGAAMDQALVITGVDIIDVESASILPNRSIVIESDRIVNIVPAGEYEPSKGARLIDGRGKFAMPGLWDMHIHMVSDEPPVSWDMYDPEATDVESRQTYMPLQVAFGITGVRELSGGEWSLKLRDQLENGELLGPHMIVGSPLLDGPFPLFPGPGVMAIRNADEARAAVGKLYSLGYDFLKTYQLLSPGTYREIHKTAKELGIEVSGEVPIGVSLWEAAELGHRTVEHLTGVEFACSAREDELRSVYRDGVAAIAADSTLKTQVELWNRSEWEPLESFDPEKCSRLYAHLVENGIWVVPTLVVQRIISYPNIPAVRDNPNNKYLHKYDADVSGFIEQYDPERRLRPTYDHRFNSISDLHEAGVGILAGSDLPGGFPLHEELEILVEAGLSPAEALRTATLNPASYLGRQDDFGSIAVGKSADVVLLRANPLADIRNTQSIDAVILQGQYLDRAKLDRFLDQAEADARAWESEL